MADIITALQTGITSINENLMSTLGTIVPLALVVVGAVMVVKFGVKAFKSLANK